MGAQQPETGPEEMESEPPRTRFEDHRRTFDTFMSLTKFATIAVVVILIGLAVFLV